MPVNWTPEADRKLFLTLLSQQEVKIDSKTAAETLTAEGMQCTPRAVEERLKKLRKMALEDSASSGDSRASAAPKANAGTRRRKTTTDDNDNPSPAKKARQASKGKAKASEAAISTTVEEEQDAEGEFVKDMYFDDAEVI